MEKVRQSSPNAKLKAEVLLRDQFVEYVANSELKQLVWCQPNSTLLEVRTEAICWGQEGMPGGARGQSLSVPFTNGCMYGVQGGTQLEGLSLPRQSEMGELRELLKQE